MTLPLERCRSVLQVHAFLRDLIDPANTPKVPGVVRDRAAALLRHYPWPIHMEAAAKCSPEVFEFPLTQQTEEPTDGTVGWRGQSGPREK